MMQIGRINSPKLRPRLPLSEKSKSIFMTTCLERERDVDKNKIRTWSIMIFIITATYPHTTCHEKVTIHSQVKV